MFLLLWLDTGRVYPSSSWLLHWHCVHNSDDMMGAMASQITSFKIVYSTLYSGADQRKHQSAASLAFVRGIHRSPMNSPRKGPVTRKMFPFDDVIMINGLVQDCSDPVLMHWSCRSLALSHRYGRLSSNEATTRKILGERNLDCDVLLLV